MARRLEEVAQNLYDGNVSELARAIEMQPASFYKYINGERRPGTVVLRRLAQLGICLHWFLTGEGSMLRSSSETLSPLPLLQNMDATEDLPSEKALQRVPFVRFSTDENGGPALKEIGTAEWLPKSFIRRTYGCEPELLKTFRVSGDTMQGVLHPGDRVRGVLWKGESLTDGAIYLIQSGESVVYRRVRFSRNCVRLTAEHPEIEPQVFEAGTWRQEFRPIAQIVEFVRSL